MSVIIGIVSDNFCSLISDGRLVSVSQVESKIEQNVVSDEAQKIYKLNSRVLIGGTGIFQTTETVLTPLVSIKDGSTASVKVVYASVRDFLHRHKDDINQARNYVIGGKDKSGRFCLYQMHFNPLTHKIEQEKWEPKMAGQYGVVCSLPPSLSDKTSYYLAEIEKCIHSAQTHDKLLEKVSDVIVRIANVDDTVGKQTYSVSVF